MRRQRLRAAVIVSVLALMAGACGDDDEPTVQPDGVTTTVGATERGATLAITEPASGTAVKGNVVNLKLTGGGIDIVRPDGDTSGRTGHYHVFIDRDPVPVGAVIPREPGIVHSPDNPVLLTGLSVGTHRLRVVYGDGAHNRIGTAEAETSVRVEGPSVKATAPGTVTAGQALAVSMSVEGIQLVSADGDRSGRTGHLHVFVDRDPTPAGQPVPTGDPNIIHTTETTVTVPSLAAGQHTIWVVVGDGAHYPLEPRVADRLQVTVS